MAQILLQKIINNEISLEEIYCWIAQKNSEDSKCHDLTKICFQEEFVACFLNIIHGLQDSNPQTETPVKLHSSASTSNHLTVHRRSLFTDQQTPESLKLSDSLNNSTSHSLSLSGITSTPKMHKYTSYNEVDDSFSPIRKNLSICRKEIESPRSSSFCLGDFIVPNKKNNKKKLQRHSTEAKMTTPKRINPTNLSERTGNNVFVSNENSFNFKDNTDIITLSSENANRSFLKMEIERISAKPKTVDENILEQMKKNLDSKPASGMEIFPNPKLVKFREKLEKVILIYEYLLKNSLVVSVIGEIHFVISLLFNKCYCESVSSHEDLPEDLVTFEEIFKSVHNVVYFACCMLEKFIFFLKSLDKSTLKFMCVNERLILFSPDLTSSLTNIADEKTERSLNLYESRGKRNICFVLDTDNRSNFPSELSFQSFKKQRDAFYEILKIWEDGHMDTNWSFEHSLGRKIKYLLECHVHPVNFSRFARLFMDQLLSSYEKNCLEEVSDGNSTLLTSLPNIDRNKFDRLKSRLVTKESSNGLNNAPEFPGYQEFFKEFIEVSANASFLRHLCDIFISEIIELNETTFTDLDVDSTEDETDQDTKKAYVSCLKSLRVLAKFLGFVESLPYKFESPILPDNILEVQIKIREQVKPNFDVLEIFLKSISNKSLVLCVPWLCNYLSMLDPVVLKTSNYVKIIRIMVGIYKNIEKSDVPEYNIYLIKYTLGWFFELNNLQNVFYQMYFTDEIHPLYPQHSDRGIDKLLLVDHNILYIFCPYLEELKKLLSSKKVTRLNARHITPLTAAGSKIPTNNVMFQLEEAFFNGQPGSVRKTVEFVAERVASTCVKFLCYDIVPNFKKNYLKELQTELRKWKEEGNLQPELRSKAEKLAEENVKKLEKLCKSEVDKIVENNVKTAIHSLLPMDTLPSMESLCVNASKRMCLDKVKRWIFTHIVLNVLTKDITSEISKLSHDTKKKLVFLLPPEGSDVPHNENTESAAHILDKIRDHQVAILLSNTHDIDVASLVEFLTSVYRTLTERYDVNEPIHFTITSQLVDLFLLLVAFQPLIVDKSLSSFIKIWKLEGYKKKELFSNLLSRRNLMLLSQSDPKIADSWAILAKFSVVVLKEGFLSNECFESQCTGLFKWDLAEETLKNATNFLSTFVELYKKEFNSSKFTYLLEFLSDYCRDL